MSFRIAFSRCTRQTFLLFIVKAYFASQFRTFANMSNEVKIGTHDGIFHCDDVLACYLLKQLPENSGAKVIRSRNPKFLEMCNYVVDVGGIYDHEIKRYDHHQPTFNHTMSTINSKKPYQIKLSSAGLVYTHYGHRIIANLLKCKDEKDSKIDKVFEKVYENFIMEIDAIDNGVAIADGQLKYHINTNISARVKRFLPSWIEKSNADILYERFEHAMDMVGGEFEEAVNYYGSVWLAAKELVKEAVEKRFDVDKSGEIIEIISESGLPWKEHLFEIEKETDLVNSIKYVIMKNENDWRVQPVPTNPNSFELRIPLHNSWRGLRDDELSRKAGIPDCIFVHMNAFIGGNRSRIGALEMARKSIDSFKLANGN